MTDKTKKKQAPPRRHPRSFTLALLTCAAALSGCVPQGGYANYGAQHGWNTSHPTDDEQADCDAYDGVGDKASQDMRYYASVNDAAGVLAAAKVLRKMRWQANQLCGAHDVNELVELRLHDIDQADRIIRILEQQPEQRR